MDPINYFVGLTFAWVVLGLFFILPWGTVVEHLASKWIFYATNGEVRIKKRLRKWWDYLGMKCGGWYVVPLVVYYILIFAVAEARIRTGAGFPDVFIFSMFGAYVHVGAFLSPVLLILAAGFGVTIFSRKAFSFKQKVEEKLNARE